MTGQTNSLFKAIELRPLAFAAIFFALGVLLSIAFGVLPFYIPLVLLLACAALYLLTRLDKNVVVFSAAFLAALLSCSAREAFISRDNIKYGVEKYDGKRVQLLGVVDSPPEINPERNTAAVLIRANRLMCGKDERKVSGLVKASIYTELKPEELKPGQRVRVTGRLYRVKEKRNPGEFDYRSYLERRGIYALISVNFSRGEDFEVLGTEKPGFFRNAALVTRARLLLAVEKTMPGKPVEAAVVQGMILGETDNIPSAVSRNFRDSGIFHTLAVSGFNVGLVTAAVFFILRIFGAGKRFAAKFGIGAVLFYCLVAGATPSVVRATIMSVVFLSAMALEREADGLNTLGFSAIIVLLLDPLDLFDIGFQLSYAATFGIIFFTPKLQEALKPLPKWLSGALGVTLAAQIFVLPIMAYYFYSVSIISLACNLVSAPLVWAASVFGFFQAAIGIFLPIAGKLLGFVSGLAITLLLPITAFCAGLPFAVLRVAKPDIFTVFLYYAMFLLLPPLIKQSKATPVPAISVLVAINLIFAQAAVHKFTRLDIGYLSMSKAQARYANYGGGFSALYITGKPSEYDLERVVLPALYSSGVNRLSLLVCSKNAAAIAKKIKCGAVIAMDGELTENILVNSGRDFSLCISKDYTLVGKYRREYFQISGKDLYFGSDRRHIEYTDVKGDEARIFNTYGNGWREGNFK